MTARGKYVFCLRHDDSNKTAMITTAFPASSLADLSLLDIIRFIPSVEPQGI